MFDEFIILSTDRIIDVWNLRGGAWDENEYRLLYENQIEMVLDELEAKEFIARFRSRYAANATPQTETEKV